MDNQHRKIKGYRELNQEELDAMNEIKEIAARVGDLVNVLEGTPHGQDSLDADKRWVSIGKTDLQKGFMALTRSIAKPEFF